jgi:pteridine reductase
MQNTIEKTTLTALITGASKRIGREIAKTMHPTYNIIIHYNSSKSDAQMLADEFNNIRENSATIVGGNLANESEIKQIIKNVKNVNVLVNNASSFYPTPVENASSDDFHTMMNVNVLAPFLLSIGLKSSLENNLKSIINIVDIHAQRPLKNYSIYNISKAGTDMLTKTLAKELAPKIRVNGVSPGSILWPENAAEVSENDKEKMLGKIPLNRQGSPKDIAKTVLFLAGSDYITGQVISVDGGRTLNQ